MSSMENGDLELDGTFPNRYVSIPGIKELLYGNVCLTLSQSVMTVINAVNLCKHFGLRF